jgi:hypothetical protein
VDHTRTSIFGNMHTFHHRIPALSASCLSTSALVLATLAGTSCSFLEINAKPDMLLLSSDEVQLMINSAEIGVLCDNGFYAREGDGMWELSRIFLIVGLILGSLTTALAWAVTTFLPPTPVNWKIISMLSSLTAVLQVPIFLLLEAEPCTKFKIRQECTLSIGSYFLIASTVFWVAVTLSTQCMDPPLWAIELAAWKNSVESNQEADPELGDQRNLESSSDYKSNRQSRLQRWFGRKPKQIGLLHPVDTDSINEDENDREPSRQSGGYYESSTDSRLALRVQMDGKIAGDDGKSFRSSFGDLSPIVKDAEEGQLRERGSPRSPRSPDHTQASSQSKANDRMRILSEYTNPSTASRQQEHIIMIGGVHPAQSDTPPRGLDPRKVVCGLPKKITFEREQSQRVPPAQPASPRTNLKARAILKDLEEMPVSPAPQYRPQEASPKRKQTPPNVEEKGIRKVKKKVHAPPAEPEKPQGDHFLTGVRALTKKVRRDARRKSRKGHNGYAAMDDDDESFGYDEAPYQSPPIEVKIQMDANKDDQRSLTDDEDELAEEWANLHAATSAGIQFAAFDAFDNHEVEEDIQFANFDAFDNHEEEEDQPADLYHSDPEKHNDPEPVYYASDDSKSDISQSSTEGTPPKFERESDDSTISSSSSASNDKKSSRSRKSANSRNGRRGPRRRRPSLNSIRSTRSLVELTIDEETDQDILEEGADHQRKMNSYSLTRTRSAPVQLGKTAATMSQSGRARSSVDEGSPNFRVRRTSPHDDTPPASRSQVVEDTYNTHSTEKRKEDSFDGNLTDERDYSLDVDEEKKQDSLEIEKPSPSKIARKSPSVSFSENVKLSSSKSVATSPYVSFREIQSIKPVTWKDERTSIEGINARNPIVVDDSSDHSVNSGISSRARKARIDRLKPYPDHPQARSDDSSVNSNSSMRARMARIQRVRGTLIKLDTRAQEEQGGYTVPVLEQEISPWRKTPPRRGKEDITTSDIMLNVSQDSSTSERPFDIDDLTMRSPRVLASDFDPNYDNHILGTLKLAEAFDKDDLIIRGSRVLASDVDREYDNHVLQLAEGRLPHDAEYGEEEASL